MISFPFQTTQHAGMDWRFTGEAHRNAKDLKLIDKGEYFEISGDMVGMIGTEGVELELSTTELMEDFDEESPLPSGRYLYDGTVVKKVNSD